jgi:serine/threonine protein kinase
MKGQDFGNYVVREKIGEGGMGEVFLAEHRLIGRKAAVKVLRTGGCANAHDVERFFNEARAASIIDHPGVVQIFDCDFRENIAYLIMEYLEGESLAAMIRRTGKLSADPESIRLIAAQIANVLAAAHAKGIVHRDLKPDNVFLESKLGGPVPFLVRILDFGIAKLVAADAPGLTKSGTVLGTPTYMAPEQCAGDRDVDTRADIYSLGCILFEMAAGSPPFVRAGAGSLITAHMSERPPSVGEAWVSAPVAFVSLVAQMLAKDPSQRPQTMGEVEWRLHESLSLPPGMSTLSLSTTDSSSPAITVSRATPKPPAIETQMAPQVSAPSPTAVLPRSEDSIPGPTVSLPTGNPPPAPERPSSAFGAMSNWHPLSIVRKLGRKRLFLLVAAGVAAIGLVTGLAGSGRKASPPTSLRPTELPAAAAAPAPTVTAQPRVDPDEAVPPSPSIPAPAQKEVPGPSTESPPMDPPSELPTRNSSRKGDAAATEERRGQGKSPAGTKGRAASRRPTNSHPQPRLEIRGFTDF